jgi:hypothetical protein
MSESMPPLDRRFLDTLRSDSPAPSEARSRVRSRLAVAIPAMALGGSAAGSGSGGLWRRFGGWGSNGIAIATFVAGGVTGATLLASLSHAPPARVVYVDRPAPPALVAEANTFSGPPLALAGPAPTRITAIPLPQPPAPAVLATLPAPASPAAIPPHVSRFAEERKLLDDARAGLLQGEPALAIERLDAHRARFADGMLAEERDAMEVEALVRAGRVDEARAEAAAFKERSPKSLFLQTVEATVPSGP